MYVYFFDKKSTKLHLAIFGSTEIPVSRTFASRPSTPTDTIVSCSDYNFIPSGSVFVDSISITPLDPEDPS